MFLFCFILYDYDYKSAEYSEYNVNSDRSDMTQAECILIKTSGFNSVSITLSVRSGTRTSQQRKRNMSVAINRGEPEKGKRREMMPLNILLVNRGHAGKDKNVSLVIIHFFIKSDYYHSYNLCLVHHELNRRGIV